MRESLSGLDLLKSLVDIDAIEENTLAAVAGPLDRLAEHVDALSAQSAANHAKMVETLGFLDQAAYRHHREAAMWQTEREMLQTKNRLLHEELKSSKRDAQRLRIAHEQMTADPTPHEEPQSGASMVLNRVLEMSDEPPDHALVPDASSEVQTLRALLKSRDEELRTLFRWAYDAFDASGFDTSQELRRRGLSYEGDDDHVELEALQHEVDTLELETAARQSDFARSSESPFLTPVADSALETIIEDVERQADFLRRSLADCQRESLRLKRLRRGERPFAPLPTDLETAQSTVEDAQSDRADISAMYDTACKRAQARLTAQKRYLDAAEQELVRQRRHRSVLEAMLDDAYHTMERMAMRLNHDYDVAYNGRRSDGVKHTLVVEERLYGMHGAALAYERHSGPDVIDVDAESTAEAVSSIAAAEDSLLRDVHRQRDATASLAPSQTKRRLRVIVLCGWIGVGKTTLSKAWVALKPEWARVCQDELGERSACENMMRMHLSQGRSCLVDRQNFDAQQRSHWISIARAFGAEVCALVFTTSYHDCEVRLARRVGHETLRDPMHALKVLPQVARQFRPPTDREGFDRIVRLPRDLPLTYDEPAIDRILTLLDSAPKQGRLDALFQPPRRFAPAPPNAWSRNRGDRPAWF